jgi:hypothetical protein
LRRFAGKRGCRCQFWILLFEIGLSQDCHFVRERKRVRTQS